LINRFKTTEKSARIIEASNTLVIEVDRKAKKPEIKKDMENKFKIKVYSINTHIFGNKKYAYVRLDKKNPAIDLATKFGVL
jgi:large subunit ribosomal protein L23